MDHVQTGDGRLRVWETYRRVTPDELYRFWTEPAKLELWWPPVAAIDPTVGGRYEFSFPELGETLSGTFSEVVPGERLAFSWNWQDEPDTPEGHVTVDFEARDRNTLLTVTHSGYGGNGDGVQKQLEGWQHFLGRLERHIRAQT